MATRRRELFRRGKRAVERHREGQSGAGQTARRSGKTKRGARAPKPDKATGSHWAQRLAAAPVCESVGEVRRLYTAATSQHKAT